MCALSKMYTCSQNSNPYDDQHHYVDCTYSVILWLAQNLVVVQVYIDFFPTKHRFLVSLKVTPISKEMTSNLVWKLIV